MKKLLLIILLLVHYLSVDAQEFVQVKTIWTNARYMTADELGNIYIIRNDNTLIRYNENGDSTGFYKAVLNGDIGFVDATNPLRILVYYPQYLKVLVLDRMLTVKNELNLRKMNFANGSVVASSADGTVWVYDKFNARLKKINDQLNELITSNDLRQELQKVPLPVFMTERDWKVYLTDTSQGIFVFDRYGNFLTNYPIAQLNYLQVAGSKLIYRHENELHIWDVDKVKENTLLLPVTDHRIISASLIRNNLYVLYEDRFSIYKLSEN